MLILLLKSKLTQINCLYIYFNINIKYNKSCHIAKLLLMDSSEGSVEVYIKSLLTQLLNSIIEDLPMPTTKPLDFDIN